MTSVFATDTPSRSTLRPNRIAPNPHANPNASAATTAPFGACEKSWAKLGTVAATIANGPTRQLVTMKTSQMFSHFQFGINFIGAVNSPLQIPERSA